MPASPSHESECPASRPRRLDAVLVARELARSREHAVSEIKAGKVTVNGAVAKKPVLPVSSDAEIVVPGRDEPAWAPRFYRRFYRCVFAARRDRSHRG